MTKQLPGLIIKLVSLLLSLLGENRSQKVKASLSGSFCPIIDVKTNRGDIRVLCSSRRALYWAKNFLTHEPETIEWINSFSKGDVFWDIGANVGIYSLFAAQAEDIKVLSFEPMSESFASLQKNIYLNDREEDIECFCLALSESKTIWRLSLSSTDSGSDSHTFGNNSISLENDKHVQPILCLAIDEFLDEFNPAFPTHIKIDVDGPEVEILKGATNTLKDLRLRSVLIEGDVEDSEKNRQIFPLLENAGLVLDSRGSTANSSLHCNYLFKRKD